MPPRRGSAHDAEHLCDARAVAPADALIVALAVGLVIAVVAAARLRASLDRVRAATGDPSEEPATAVRHLRGDAEHAARTLAEERAERAALEATLAAGVLRVDDADRITEASDTAHALLERPSGALVGRSLMEAFLDPAAEAAVATARDVGSAIAEIRRAGPDGPALLVRARRSTSGGAWLVLDDVSELRRLQRIRAEFIDNLSHELRTPLTTVSLLAETLAREAAAAGDRVPDRMRERITKIEVETGHLVQMVNELLDLSRIEGGGTLELVDGVDLGRLAAASAERLRLFAERQGVALRVEAAEAVPPIRGDAARLGQVVINLVHNAVKFSPDGGDVTVRVRRDGDEVVVSVEDHGVGIPPAARDRVFERFYKVDRARSREGTGGGTGLGLAIARHVVEQHGGRIWLVSEEGRGSMFTFALPIPT